MVYSDARNRSRCALAIARWNGIARDCSLRAPVRGACDAVGLSALVLGFGLGLFCPGGLPPPLTPPLGVASARFARAVTAWCVVRALAPARVCGSDCV
jgi:hypothetical protein